MPTFSFDIISDYDKAEVNNVFQHVQREMSNRYDFKNTPANIDWLDEKKGFVVIGNSEWQLETIIDMIRRQLINRSQSTKILDLQKTPSESNLKITKEIPFIAGLNQDKAKEVSKYIRETLPKVKSAIQGDTVRVTSSSKDELQKTMQALREHEFDFPLSFTNFR